MGIVGFRSESNKSGQAFREDILYPKICEAIKNKETLKVGFTDMLSLISGFLEESFGGLVREHGMKPDEVLKTIEFLSKNNLLGLYIELSKEYIQEAEPGKEPEAFRTY